MIFLSVLISKSSSLRIRDVAMREIRNQIIVIHKDSTKRTNQLYRMLHRNPHLGLQFRLRSWWLTIVNRLGFPFLILHFLLEGYNYYIKSYPPIVLSNILQFILFPLKKSVMIRLRLHPSQPHSLAPFLSMVPYSSIT